MANIQAPLSACDGNRLSTNFSVQLALADGSRLGEPVPILAPGLFADGIRVLDGVPPGATASVKLIALDASDAFYAETPPFALTTGGAGTPPSLPPAIPSGVQLDCERPALFLSDPVLQFAPGMEHSVDLLIRPYPLSPPGWFAVPEEFLEVHADTQAELVGATLDNGTLHWTPEITAGGRTIPTVLTATDNRDGTILDTLETVVTVVVAEPGFSLAFDDANVTFAPGSLITLSGVIDTGQVSNPTNLRFYGRSLCLLDSSFGPPSIDSDSFFEFQVPELAVPQQTIPFDLLVALSPDATAPSPLLRAFHHPNLPASGLEPELRFDLPTVTFARRAPDAIPPEITLMHEVLANPTDSTEIQIGTTVTFAGEALLSVLLRPELPENWTITEVAGTGGLHWDPETCSLTTAIGGPELDPLTGEILWVGALPTGPLEIRYTVEVPATAVGTFLINHEGEIQRISAINPESVQPLTEPIEVVRIPAPPEPVIVSHSGPETYTPTEPLTISGSIIYEGNLISLLWRPILPEGWQLDSVTGAGQPEIDRITGEVIWLGAIPVSPLELGLQMTPGAAATETVEIQNSVEYQFIDQINPIVTEASPKPLTLNLREGPPRELVTAYQTLQHIAGDRGRASITVTIEVRAPLQSLRVKPDLPEGWTIQEISGSGGPELSTSSNEIVWPGQIPVSTVELTYTALRRSGNEPLQIDHEINFLREGTADASTVSAIPQQLQTLDIHNVARNETGMIAVSFQSRADSYYILFKRVSLQAEANPVAIALGSGNDLQLIDDSDSSHQAFFRLVQRSTLDPQDIDNDGQNDLVEIEIGSDPFASN